MMDSAGWSIKSFLEFDSGPAKNDEYGKLYFYLSDLFVKFHRRVRSLPAAFELLHLDARALPSALAGRHFDRIDVGGTFHHAGPPIEGFKQADFPGGKYMRPCVPRNASNSS
jgi:hypothetical protein